MIDLLLMSCQTCEGLFRGSPLGKGRGSLIWPKEKRMVVRARDECFGMGFNQSLVSLQSKRFRYET